MTKNGVGFTNNYKKMASNIEVNKKYENIFLKAQKIFFNEIICSLSR